MPSPRAHPSVDMHVHIAGNGLDGSGCRLGLRGWRHLMVAYMTRHIGLPAAASQPDFDTLYVDHLARLVSASSLGRAVILAQDQVYDDQGGVMADWPGFYVPNAYVLDLAKRHPQFLPGVSIHPGRLDALEELDRCLAGGAVLMKCLPNCHNIDCNLPRYRPFWERLAAAGLPLLAHTGGEHTVPVVRRALENPAVLRLPLACGVKVIAAHCATKSGLTDPEYFFQFAAMTREFPNLYGDTSAFSVPIRGRHVRRCLEQPLAERLVHGSDFPVPVQALWPFLGGFISWVEYRRCRRIANPLERDFQLKRAMGFPPEHFTRIWSLLRKI